MNMDHVYNQFLEKMTVNENEVRAMLLLYFSQNKDNSFLLEFINSFDVTFEEIKELIEWLHNNGVDSLRTCLTEECELKLLERDISNKTINFERVNEYIYYFSKSIPWKIVPIYKFLDKKRCLLSLSNYQSYPLKKNLHIYTREKLTVFEQFKNEYPAYPSDRWYGDINFLEDISTFAKKHKYNDSVKEQLINSFDNEDTNITLIEDDKVSYIQDGIDSLAIEDVIDKNELNSFLENFNLTKSESVNIHNYTKKNYRIIDIEDKVNNLNEKTNYLNQIFEFRFSHNEVKLLDLEKNLKKEVFNDANFEDDDYFEKDENIKYITLDLYAKLIITQLICLSIEQITDKYLSYDYIEDIAEEFDLNAKDYSLFIDLFKGYKNSDFCDLYDNDIDSEPFSLKTDLNTSLYGLSNYIIHHTKFNSSERIEQTQKRFCEPFSDISLNLFCEKFPIILRYAKSQSQKDNENKIDCFIKVLLEQIKKIIESIVNNNCIDVERSDYN